MLQLFAHPFSSYCMKVLIPMWADGTPFAYRILAEQHPEHMDQLKALWPFGQFPVLLDDDRPIVESTVIIEHLAAHHPGPNRWIPDGEEGRRVRFLDRFFDSYVMNQMTVPVFNAIRPEDQRDPYGEVQARARLTTAYDWLEANLPDGEWAVGDSFTLADCAAAPSLFYADWVEEIGPARPRLAAYRARLLAYPVVAWAIDEARPYRAFFPLSAPDRD